MTEVIIGILLLIAGGAAALWFGKKGDGVTIVKDRTPEVEGKKSEYLEKKMQKKEALKKLKDKVEKINAKKDDIPAPDANDILDELNSILSDKE